MTFHFLRPYWLLMLIPLLGLSGWMWRSRSQSGAWNQVIAPQFIGYLLSVRIEKNRSRQLLSVIAAWLICVIALAGPTFNRISVPMMQNVQAAAIVLNLSKSMDAQDVSPSRLERAKLKLKDLLKMRADGLTALVAYAGDAHVVTPLSNDVATIDSMISSLTTDIMPVGGNDALTGLDKARQLLEPVNGRDILLITDGVNPNQLSEIGRLISTGKLRLSVLGIGTEQGSPVLNHEGSFYRDQSGQVIVSKANMRSLQQLAENNGGSWLTLSSSDAHLEKALKSNAIASNDGAKSKHVFDEWHDLGYYLVFLLFPVAALLFRRGQFICIFLLLAGNHLFAWSVGDLFLNRNQRGHQALKDKRYAEASELLSESEWRGVAEYQEKKYPESAEFFQRGTGTNDLYNLGNALAAQGKIDAAITAYEKSLALNSENADARFNKELLEKLKKEQEQQKQQEKDDQSKSDDKSEQKESDQKNSESKQKSDHSKEEEQATTSEKEKEKEQKNNDQKKEQAKKATENKKKEPLDAASLEEQIATEQMLRRIPDDPGGLLKRKFYYESQKRGGK